VRERKTSPTPRLKSSGDNNPSFIKSSVFRISAVAVALLIIVIFLIYQKSNLSRTGKTELANRSEISGSGALNSVQTHNTSDSVNNSIGANSQKVSREPSLGAPGQNAVSANSGEMFPSEKLLQTRQKSKPVDGNSELSEDANGISGMASPPVANTATIFVQSEPAGAEIWLNGKWEGNTPKKIIKLTSGNYQLKLAMDGYQSIIKTLNIKGDSNPSFNEKLAPLTGGLIIETDPNSALVYLDGEEIKQSTPLQLTDVAIGIHQLEIRKKGFDPVTRETAVTSGQTEHIALKLDRLTGELTVQVRPWGSIYLNDKLQKSSSDLRYKIELPVDHYQLKVVHPTLGVWEKEIEITPDNNKEIVVDFNHIQTVPVTAVDDTGNPVHAEIYLDEQNTGKMTPSNMELKVGLHKISVKKEGYLADNEPKTILIDKGFKKPQKFVLKKIDKGASSNQ